MKNTKRALFLSALAIVMSVAMLIGSTFAWFTDSASTAVNTIQSGTLDVALEYSLDDGANWLDAEGETLDFVKADGAAANEAVLWEPNCTYELPLIRVRNNGNLALKYEISVIGATGDLELFDVISFTAAIDGAAEVALDTFTGHLDAKDASSEILIKGHMDKDAGNDYQGLEIKNIAINVLATQYTYESDSNDNQYDKDAMYAVANDLYIDKEDGSYIATSTDGLSSVATLASKDSTITYVTYVTDAGEVEVPVVREQTALSSAITSNEEVIVATSGDYTMPEPDLRGKELTIIGTEDTVIDVSNVDTRDQFVTGASVVFEGVTLNFDNGTKIYMGFANTENLIYRNCHITGMQMLFGENVTFENCVLDSSANTGEPHSVWTYGAKNINFIDCKFIYGHRAINCYKDQDIEGGKQVVNFKNCIFTTTDVNSEGAVEINSSAFSVGIEVNMEGCTAPVYGPIAYVSPWDSTNGVKTTINIK